LRGDPGGFAGAFPLDVFVTDSDHSTPNLDQWQQTENGVSTSGRLRLDGAEQYREYSVSFEARCK